VRLHAGQRLDPGDRLVVERRHLHRQPADRPQLDLLAAVPMGELLVGDAVEPRDPGRADVAEALPALERDGEGLGQQVAGDLGVEHAAVEVREQPVRPAVVQLAERARIVARGEEQFSVGPSHRSHNAASGADCYACVSQSTAACRCPRKSTSSPSMSTAP
jgi:hypothetical protein